MSDELEELKKRIAGLEQENEELGTTVAATQSVLLTLVRYLAEGQQLYIHEFCDDLDKTCTAHDDPVWQQSMMSMTEMLRALGARL